MDPPDTDECRPSALVWLALPYTFMATTRTVTVDASDDCPPAEYAQKLSHAMKALLVGVPPAIKAQALAEILAGDQATLQLAIKLAQRNY